MKYWISELAPLLASGQDVMRVVVTSTRGSAPREAGAAMLIHRDGSSGTLGGGHLEFKAIALARELMAQDSALAHSQRFSLAAALGQCCGGIVDLWWERFTPADSELIAEANRLLNLGRTVVLVSLVSARTCVRKLWVADTPYLPADVPDIASHLEALIKTTHNTSPVRLLQFEHTSLLLERLDRKHTPLWVFGAGHVGQAIVEHLRDLPFDITWVDSREGVFPANLPVNVRTLESDVPEAEVRYAPDDAWFLILTHDHELDYAICAALLAQQTGHFIGLIGSRTKAARFAHRLDRQGYSSARITCPIGIPGISGKEPATIAISVVAQLLQLREQLVKVQSNPQQATGQSGK